MEGEIMIGRGFEHMIVMTWMERNGMDVFRTHTPFFLAMDFTAFKRWR